MYIANIKYNDVSNGPGVRTSVFVSGCRHHCPGCFNEAAWKFDCGQPITKNLTIQILDSIDHPWIEGMTILGGEPFEPENQPAVLDLVMEFRRRFGNSKSLWIYSGFTLEELKEGSRASRTSAALEILMYCDVLVDGKFVDDLKDISLQFRGSSNQRILRLKDVLR